MVNSAWLRRSAVSGVTAMMAIFGLTGIASAQTITNTGPRSTNVISSSSNSNCQVTNNNNVSATSSNTQNATTGDATSSNNTTAGFPWTGWSALDPAVYQAGGQNYGAWQAGVTQWMTQRASGAGWNSNDANLSWTPASSDWNGFDPMAWQAAGQSFGNWFNAVQSYLNSNSSNWILTWPSEANGNGMFGGTTTGDATNNYNASFSINISNGAQAAAGTNSCGQSNYVPPVSTGGGMGGGWSAPASSGSVGSVARSYGGGSGGGSSRYYAPVAHTSAPAPAAATSAPVSQPVPVAPSAPVAPVSSGNSISNTGPGSSNTISSSTNSNYQVTNNNNVSVTSSNSQTASTGNSSSTGNTSAGGAGSGDASNNAGSGAGVGISN